MSSTPPPNTLPPAPTPKIPSLTFPSPLFQLTIRLCEGRFSPHHDVTIGVEFGSRIVPVGPPASLTLHINNPNPPTSPSPTPSLTPTLTSPPSNPQPSPPSPSASPRQKRMKLSLWDTAGQETYKSITRSYFRGASGALLVYDISRRATFTSLTAWLHDLRQIAEENIVVVLVGNKRDLADASTVRDAPTPQEGDPTQSGDDGSAANKRAVTREEAQEWCRRNGVLQYVETSAKSGEGVERAFLEVAERIYRNIEAGRYDLNDRRSGVKGPGAGGGGGAGRGGADGAVVLGMNDVVGKTGGGWGGGCC